MKTNLKPGASAYYGVIHGAIIGVFVDYKSHNNDRAIFMSYESRQSFKEIGKIYQEIPHSCRSSLPKWLYSYFATDDLNFLHNKKKFLVVNLSELKQDNKQEDKQKNSYKSSINKRHLLIKMACFYVKQHKSSEDIHRVCERIEGIQQEIEQMETRAHKHLAPPISILTNDI